MNDAPPNEQSPVEVVGAGPAGLAARSLLEGTDYDAAWQREFKRPMETARVNRAIYNRLGNRGYRWILRFQKWNGDGREFLSWLYRSKRLRRSIFALTQRIKA